MLIKYIDMYAETPNGKFLKEIDYHNLKYMWCYNMTIDTVTGAWSCAFPNNIYLCPPSDNTVWENDVATKMYHHLGIVIPTVIHELFHKYQRAMLGFAYYCFCCLPIIRDLTIEPPAYKHYDLSDDWFTKIQQEEYQTQRRELLLKYMGEENYDFEANNYRDGFNREYCKQQFEKYKIDRRQGRIPAYYPNIIGPPYSE